MKNVLFVAATLAALSTSAFAGVCPTTPPVPGSKCYPLPGRTAYPGVHYKNAKNAAKVYDVKYFYRTTGGAQWDHDFQLNNAFSN
jgi:hypothetical protein